MDAFIESILLDGQGIGVVSLCVFLALGFMRGWIVPRRTLQDMIDDRNSWRKMAEELKADITRLQVIGELGVHSIKAIEEKAKSGGEERG